MRLFASKTAQACLRPTTPVGVTRRAQLNIAAKAQAFSSTSTAPSVPVTSFRETSCINHHNAIYAEIIMPFNLQKWKPTRVTKLLLLTATSKD